MTFSGPTSGVCLSCCSLGALAAATDMGGELRALRSIGSSRGKLRSAGLMALEWLVLRWLLSQPIAPRKGHA